ncbi:hypothetical protein KCU62_g313, partial [Aureobasidium sp. EXF-3399]
MLRVPSLRIPSLRQWLRCFVSCRLCSLGVERTKEEAMKVKLNLTILNKSLLCLFLRVGNETNSLVSNACSAQRSPDFEHQTYLRPMVARRGEGRVMVGEVVGDEEAEGRCVGFGEGRMVGSSSLSGVSDNACVDRFFCCDGNKSLWSVGLTRSTEDLGGRSSSGDSSSASIECLFQPCCELSLIFASWPFTRWNEFLDTISEESVLVWTVEPDITVEVHFLVQRRAWSLAFDVAPLERNMVLRMMESVLPRPRRATLGYDNYRHFGNATSLGIGHRSRCIDISVDQVFAYTRGIIAQSVDPTDSS